MQEPAPRLRLESLSKSFEGRRVLNEVGLTIPPGRVHALVGHNGSGKSTLIKILSGFHEPDPGGAIFVDGQSLRTSDPVASRRAGIRCIHQDLGLIDDFSVLENLRIDGGYQTGRLGPIRWGQETRAAQQLLDRFDIHVSPTAGTSTVSPVERTEIVIARALQHESEVGVLVLDEPTATMPDRQLHRLFRLIRRVAGEGVSILYVSHRLEELYEIADDISVLRDGSLVATTTPKACRQDQLIDLMLGTGDGDRKGESLVRGQSRPRQVNIADNQVASKDETLRLTNIGAGRLEDMGFSVRRGEVVGIAGLAGSGVHDIPQLLLGRTAISRGYIEVLGSVVRKPSPKKMLDLKVAILPSSKELKTLGSMTIRENVTLPDLAPFWRKGFLRRRLENQQVFDLLRAFSVRPDDPSIRFGTLSGGNQQKAVVAKWMRLNPVVLVLDEPTAGVDVMGRAEILRLVGMAAAAGVAVVVCSSDLDDLAEICHRVVVIRHGRNAVELEGEAVTRDVIAAECYRE